MRFEDLRIMGKRRLGTVATVTTTSCSRGCEKASFHVLLMSRLDTVCKSRIWGWGSVRSMAEMKAAA
ncbi:hypothetical protein Hanom_Chr11g00976521 [Helianthus anomalus]